MSCEKVICSVMLISLLLKFRAWPRELYCRLTHFTPAFCSIVMWSDSFGHCWEACLHKDKKSEPRRALRHCSKIVLYAMSLCFYVHNVEETHVECDSIVHGPLTPLRSFSIRSILWLQRQIVSKHQGQQSGSRKTPRTVDEYSLSLFIGQGCAPSTACLPVKWTRAPAERRLSPSHFEVSPQSRQCLHSCRASLACSPPLSRHIFIYPVWDPITSVCLSIWLTPLPFSNLPLSLSLSFLSLRCP